MRYLLRRKIIVFKSSLRNFMVCNTRHASSLETIKLNGRHYRKDHMTNVPQNITDKMNRQLHNTQDHPLEIIKTKIFDHFHGYFRNRHGGCVFAAIDNISPVVTVQQNFDNLLVPKDHVSRSKQDNYYINEYQMLRAHTTAHEIDLISSGWNAFLNVGDCYRRDAIDKSHFPVFHQLEGVRIFDDFELFEETKDSSLRILEKTASERTNEKQAEHTIDAARITEFNLKYTLMKLVEHLFGDNVEMRWVDAYFPFTHPSWELEVKLNGEWMEMLGCGILEQQILKYAGAGDRIGWAFGLGLERFAMKLFDIPDIRLFWSEDDRFLKQFKSGGGLVNKFQPFSKYPPSYKDISFWVNDTSFSSNDLYEVARTVGGDVIEEMTLVDQFVHPKTQQESHCYRITYRAMDRTLRDEEVNEIQNNLRSEASKLLHITLR